MTKSLGILPRLLLLTAVILGISSGLDAQQLSYPVSGLYVGVAGGFNLKGNESIKNLSSNLQSLNSSLSTPNLNVGTNIGGAAFGAIGWGSVMVSGWKRNSTIGETVSTIPAA